MQEYREKLDSIKEKYGWPFLENAYPKPLSIKSVLDDFQEDKKISLAGRLVAKREHGKSSFAHLQDITGKIQLYFRLDIVGEECYSLFKALDIGDIIGVGGKLFKTRTGEITILVEQFKLLAKTLRSLPEKWHGLKDVEIRYRQRYLDLIANSESRDTFVKRSRLISAIRRFFADLNYHEVETPLLQVLPGGASGKPFATHHNAMDYDVYLRIAPELYLKRLLVGGFDRVYELNKSFRNEGTSTRHSPEFTMLEAYCAYENYAYMTDLCEKLISGLVEEFTGSLVFEYQGKKIDFTPPWARISFAELLNKEFGVLESDAPSVVFDKLVEKLKIKADKLSRNQLLNIAEELIEKHYPQDKPVFIVDFFTWTSPLAKTKKDNPHLVERFELFIAGLEVANAYSELNDPLDQKKRFREQLEHEEELPKKIDEDFLMSLEYGMPPAAGLGIGIDRLAMIIFNQPSIRDVILFPLLKPLNQDDT